MLSASQWTSRNRINNCVGTIGPVGPSGATGPSSPPGNTGQTGNDGISGNTGGIGEPGEGGEDGAMSLGVTLPVTFITFPTSIRTIDLNVINVGTTYVMQHPGTPSSPGYVTLNINATPTFQSLNPSNFWIRLKPAFFETIDTQLNILVNMCNNNVVTSSLETSITSGVNTPLLYVYWNGTNLIIN